MFGAGVAAVLDSSDGTAGGVVDGTGAGHEILDELGLLARRNVEGVVQHHDLAGGLLASPDADGDDVQRLRHFGRQCGWNGFEHDHRRPGVLQRQSVVLELLCGGIALALHLVATEHVHRLRCQADMAADRDAARDEEGDGGCHLGAAFELDHLGAGGHQGDGVAESLLWRFLITAERHVGDDEGTVAAALDGGGVVSDVGDGHRQRRVVALDDVTERIADQQAVDRCAIEQAGKAGVVAGEHDDFFAGSVQLGEIGLGQAAGGDLCGHLRPEDKINGA